MLSMRIGLSPSSFKSKRASVLSRLTVAIDHGRYDGGYNSVIQQTITPVVSGNSLIFAAKASNSAGAPVITDSAGNTWGAPVYTAVASAVTWRWYVLDNVTNAPTWINAQYPAAGFLQNAAIEVSGVGSGVVLDSGTFINSVPQSNTWDFPFTATANESILMAFGTLQLGTVASGQAPLVSTSQPDDYSFYASGLFEGTGEHIGIVNLAGNISGDKGWAVFRAGT